MNTQPTPTLTSPESRTGNDALLTRDELTMLTDFHDVSLVLPAKISSSKNFAQRQLAFPLAGLCILFVSVLTKPLNEREGLWKPPAIETQAAPKALAATTNISGWQAFQNWQGIVLEDDEPPLDPSILLPPAAPILAKINLPVSNPSGSAPIRGETSMPEVQRVNPVTVSNKTPTQSPTTSSGSKTPTPSNSGSPNLLTAIFNSLSNTKQSATPTSSGLAATLSASSGVARSLSNLGGNQASQSHSSSTSNAVSRGNSSGGGGFGFGGNRRG